MRSLRKLSPSPSHEALFVERYHQLFGWLLQLTEGDHELAEDLVQDAFIQFTFTRPDLNSIRNLDGYLYGLVRNLHLSGVRRTANNRLQPLSILDYDSSEIGLQMTDPRDQIQVQDELRRICHYACVRKESAWAGSVLILRFFHGYYPSEISKLLRNSRQSVDVLLKCARREARAFLRTPKSLGFMTESPTAQLANASFARATDDFLIELRQMIFRSGTGDCLSGKRLQRLYRTAKSETISCSDLAHIVSCETCLDEVNNQLGFAKLAERYPTDTIGREAPSKRDEGGGGGMGGGPSGGATGGEIGKSHRRAKAIFEHRPQELHIAVNGFVLGSQKINSRLNEQTLDVNLSEPISFVEVFSEQKLRLLFSCVDTPPEGPHHVTKQIELSEGRRLDVTLRFRTPWPTLHIAYNDPTFNEFDATIAEAIERDPAAPLPVRQIESAQRARENFRQYFLSGVAALREVFSRHFWLRPSAITAIVAVLLVGVLLFLRTSNLPLSASEILNRSVVAEQTQLASSDQVLHRTINFEERRVGQTVSLSRGELIARYKIEVWHSAERGLTVRRMYDEQSRLIAGDWRRADGTETLYAHGAKPQIQLPPDKRATITLTFGNAWQQDLTARDFSALAKSTEALRIDEKPNAYLLTCQIASTNGLTQAALVLSRADLHATEQTLIVRQGSEERVYHYLETSFERRPVSAVAPSVFDPEPELITERMKDEGGRMKEKSETASPLPLSPLPPAASTALEMEVVRLLDQAGAFSGEQVSVTRTPEGALLVEGVLDTDQRKRELLSALSSVAKNPAVKIKIETEGEAIARQSRQQSQVAPGEITLNQVQITNQLPPAYAELRKYFAARGINGAQNEREVRVYVDAVLGQSMHARQQARALRQIAGRFSQEELRTLDDEARAKWRAMILQHARSFQREAGELRRKLERVFSGSAAVEESVGDIKSDAELVQGIERLFSLWSTVDENVRQTFSMGSSGETGIAVRHAQFWQSLKTAETIAARISKQ